MPVLLLACARVEHREVRHLHLQPGVAIGAAEEGPSSLADIRSFTVDRQGRLYVLEAQAQEVRVFDSIGAHLRTVGRRGAGPGEFAMANGIALDRQDRLWVYDPGNSRVTIFDTSGTLAGTHLLSITSYGYVWDGGIDGAGRLLDPVTLGIGDSAVPALARRSLATGVADTVPLPRCRAAPVPAYRLPHGFIEVPFASGAYARLDPPGFFWCGDSRRAEILQYRLGDTVLLRRFGSAVQPAPVSVAEHDSAIARVQAFMKRAGAANLDYSLIPATKPVLYRVDSDDRGRLWMQVLDRTGFRALVFDSTGNQVADADLPFSPGPWLPTIVRGDRLYAITRDSLDVVSITRFTLREAR